MSLVPLGPRSGSRRLFPAAAPRAGRDAPPRANDVAAPGVALGPDPRAAARVLPRPEARRE